MPEEHTPPQSLQQRAAPRVWAMALIVLVGLLALAGLSLNKLSFRPSLQLKTCFLDVGGLRRGAKVRLAGVDIGVVRNVRAQPDNKTCPAAVEMEITTSYELKIPEDSVASAATAGLLGETYLEIDSSRASGPPVRTGGQLPSKESVKFTAETVDRALKAVEILKQLSDEEKNGNVPASKTRPDGKPSPAPSRP
ncbi:MAG: MlaD family protein [Candidatus Sulfotelmatobacter sp.]